MADDAPMVLPPDWQEIRRLWAELDAGGVIVCPPQMCAARDAIIAAAEKAVGDDGEMKEAVARLAAALPHRLAPRQLKAVRDLEIVSLVEAVSSKANTSEYAAAEAIALAGEFIERGRGLPKEPPFLKLELEERASIRERIERVLRWTEGKVPWPKHQQVWRIYKDYTTIKKGR